MTLPQPSPSIRSVLGALDEAERSTATATLQAAMNLADRIQVHALEEGRTLTRDEALVLAGQQLDHPKVEDVASSPRKWTWAELEALYPSGVAPWKRNAGMWAVMGMMTCTLAGLWELGCLFQLGQLEGTNRVLAALALAGTAGVFWGFTRLAGMTQESDRVFMERLKQVDSETLIRWYKSGRCLSYALVWGALADRGIRLSTR